MVFDEDRTLTIVDSIIFNKEFDVFQIRYELLKKQVSYFFVFEYSENYSGVKKISSVDFFNQFENVIYVFIDDSLTCPDDVFRWLDLIKKSGINPRQENIPDFEGGISSWVRDYFHRERACAETLNRASESAVFHFSDCDEIPYEIKTSGRYFPLAVNMRDCQGAYNRCEIGKAWHGSILASRSNFSSQSLNDLRLLNRSGLLNNRYSSGVHLSTVGTLNQIKSKIRSTAHQEYNNWATLAWLPFNLSYGYDIFWRRNVRYESVDVGLKDNLAELAFWQPRARNLLTDLIYIIGLCFHKLERSRRGL